VADAAQRPARASRAPTGPAAIARPVDANDTQPCGHMIEHLADRLTNQLQFATAAGTSVELDIEPLVLVATLPRLMMGPPEMGQVSCPVLWPLSARARPRGVPALIRGPPAKAGTSAYLPVHLDFLYATHVSRHRIVCRGEREQGYVFLPFANSRTLLFFEVPLRNCCFVISPDYRLETSFSIFTTLWPGVHRRARERGDVSVSGLP
jgi:hypothetical protein